MNAIQLLRDQLKSAHETQESTISGMTAEALHFSETNKAIPAGAAYAHSVISEDFVVSMMLAHKEPLSVGNKDTGLSQPMPPFDQWDKHEAWYKSVKIDLPKFQELAKKIYEASDEYLSTLQEADLDREVDLTAMGMGKQTVASIISNFVICHTANLTGEMSAAKGFQGLKGYPF